MEKPHQEKPVSMLDPVVIKGIFNSALRQGSVIVTEQVNKEANAIILAFLKRKDVLKIIGEESAAKLGKLVK